MTNHFIARWLGRNPGFSVAGYLLLFVVFWLTSLLALMAIGEGFRTRDALLETLSGLEGRAQPVSKKSEEIAKPWPPGSPFLEGQTETLASAALLKRLTAVVALAGGNLVSSEIQPQDSQSKAGALKANTTLEIESPRLQKLLYEIEAGMPFLFVDNLVINASGSEGDAKLRVLVQASGRWLGPK